MRTERRGFKRFNVEPVLCQTTPGTRGICLLKNVSVNGAFFMNKAPPPVGTLLNVEFSELPLEGYQVEGRVVRHGDGEFRGFAVSFLAPRPKLLRAVYHNEFFD